METYFLEVSLNLKMDHVLTNYSAIMDSHISYLKIDFSAIYQSFYIAQCLQHAKHCICICIFTPLLQSEGFMGLRSDVP